MNARTAADQKEARLNEQAKTHGHRFDFVLTARGSYVVRCVDCGAPPGYAPPCPGRLS